MVRRTPFVNAFDPVVKEHLEAIPKRHHSLIRQAITQQLLYEPDVATRNRKPLLREIEIGADWELRFGPDNSFRVLYKTDFAQRQVQVLAIGVKKGNRLTIGGQEIQL